MVVFCPSLEHRFCVDGNALEWFKSYLSDRSQTFTAGQDSHGPVSVSCSVPQGSVLGPTEFIAYIEDVTELIAAYELSYHLFVDDKQFYCIPNCTITFAVLPSPCLLYTSPSPRDGLLSRMPSSA